MKTISKTVGALALSVMLTAFNAIPTFAAANTAAPTTASVTAQADATAAYLLDSTDLSDISDTSKLRNVSRTLLMCLDTNADCDTAVTAYFEHAAAMLGDDSAFNVPIAAYGYPNDNLSAYAYLLLIAAKTDIKPDFDINAVISQFDLALNKCTANDFMYGSDPVTYANTGINPYHLGYIYEAVCTCSDKLTNTASTIAKLKTALLSISNDGGIDYYGNSADNNGNIYPYFTELYNEDSNIKTLIDKALTYTEAEYLSKEDGITHTKYKDYYTGQLIDEPSPNSTGMALALYASFGKMELAAMSYNALISNYASAVTVGAFTYYGVDDPAYTTPDVLAGIIAYQKALSASEENVDSNKENDVTVPEISDDSNEENDVISDDSDTTPTDYNKDTFASPATGDNSLITLFAALSAASALTLIINFKKQKA